MRLSKFVKGDGMENYLLVKHTSWQCCVTNINRAVCLSEFTNLYLKIIYSLPAISPSEVLCFSSSLNRWLNICYCSSVLSLLFLCLSFLSGAVKWEITGIPFRPFSCRNIWRAALPKEKWVGRTRWNLRCICCSCRVSGYSNALLESGGSV